MVSWREGVIREEESKIAYTIPIKPNALDNRQTFDETQFRVSGSGVDPLAGTE